MKKKEVKITAHMTPRDKEELFEDSKPWNRYKYGTLCDETLQRFAEIAARA